MTPNHKIFYLLRLYKLRIIQILISYILSNSYSLPNTNKLTPSKQLFN